jgi:outer membrane protein assembly factor BamB
MIFSIGLVAALLPTALAVFQDEAWKVDYHYALLGLPQPHTTFFHKPQANSKASLLYTLSELGRLGAINPKDGSIVWRQQLESGVNSNSSFLFPGPGQSTVISGVDGQVASWSAVDGKLIWSAQRNLPGTLVHLNSLQAPVSDLSSKTDVVALFQGQHGVVQRLDALTGTPLWQYEDNT